MLDSNVKATTYTATDLTNGTEYGFKVKACVNGKWSAASLISYATPTE
ncbi:MAG: fibronectin type III domain-containing protein [Oscillospiraceae bacterium]|nr:fibronectin type III domain-containing protein [Oscillospiraceae bacterium]